MENAESQALLQVSTALLREKIRNYSREQREKLRANEMDALRFGLGEIQAKIEELHNLTEKDVSGLAARIKRRKHATVEDMYRLSHAFLQSLDNISSFSKIPGAIQVLVKELTGKDAERQVAASECICNLSLGEAPVCEKIASMAGSYLVTYLDATEEHLKRCSLWTLANVLATGGKAAQTLMQMELVSKLWHLYIVADELAAANVLSCDDYREDAGICLQVISTQAEQLLRAQDRVFVHQKLHTKNPTCVGGEYHLQILFNCDIVSPLGVLSEEQTVYLINYALSNLTQYANSNLQSVAHRLRIIYAIRMLGNLIALQPLAYNVLLSQLSTVWQTNLIQILNQLFSLQNEILGKETFWLLQTLLHEESAASSLQRESFLQKLRIPKANLCTI